MSGRLFMAVPDGAYWRAKAAREAEAPEDDNTGACHVHGQECVADAVNDFYEQSKGVTHAEG